MKTKKTIYWYIFFWYTVNLAPTLCQEYLYPVGHLYQDGLKLLLLYQKSVHHIELWQWDPQTQEAHKALLSTYTPAGLQMLLGGNGYSFVDNDTLCIKFTHKRSPKRIPLYEPLYDFTTLKWLDDAHCLLSACEHDTFGIYIVDIKGECWQILHDNTYDYRYPSYINDTLFYIKRTASGQHTIEQAHIDFNEIKHPKIRTVDNTFAGDDTRQLCAPYDTKTILHCGQSPIAFLHMVNDHEGFYLEHPPAIDKHAHIITFSYCHLIKEQQGNWQSKKLFEFCIPLRYLVSSEDRLYESILPFLPKLFHEKIYFFSTDTDNETLVTQLMCYDTYKKTITPMTNSLHSAMGTYTLNNVLWYGGFLQEDVHASSTPTAWINDNGQLHVSLASITT